MVLNSKFELYTISRRVRKQYILYSDYRIPVEPF